MGNVPSVTNKAAACFTQYSRHSWGMFRCGMIEINNVPSLRASGLVCVRPVGNNGVGSTRRQGNRASILASDLGDWTHATLMGLRETHLPFTFTLLAAMM